MHWQVQQVKQRLSEVLRAAESGGPQFVTRHGEDVAVVISIGDFHRMQGGQRKYKDFNDWLLNGPKLDMTDDEIDELFARDRTPDTREIPFVGPDWE